MNASSQGFRQYFPIFFKGMAMGAADVVPGVSGGTIAFITGIYDRLVGAIAACTPTKLGWLLKGRIREAWQSVDGNFMVALLAGVLTSIFSLAKLILHLLETYPVHLWSFFFGLIMISVWVIGRQIPRWNAGTLLAALAGAGFAYLITVAVPLQLPATLPVIFFAAAIAICAMILPGISGSFLLLLMGLYAPVLDAVISLDLVFIGVFGLGCIVGLVSFSRLLEWLLGHARHVTLAFLTGLMVGSLNKVWPWKETLSWRESSSGELEPLLQTNITPAHYQALTGEPSYWLVALALMLSAMLLVSALEWWGERT